jgi:hypothetical protein
MCKSSDRKYMLCTGQAVTADHLAEYPNSHIIGELCYRLDEGQRVTALERWETSISTKDVLPIRVELDMCLIGDARDIKCRYPGELKCRNQTRWEIGKAAIKVLIGKYMPE